MTQQASVTFSTPPAPVQATASLTLTCGYDLAPDARLRLLGKLAACVEEALNAETARLDALLTGPPTPELGEVLGVPDLISRIQENPEAFRQEALGLGLDQAVVERVISGVQMPGQTS